MRRQFGGALRTSAGVLAEIVISALMAPVMMIFQSIAVVEILAGRDAGWQTQRRDDRTVERRELYRKYGVALTARPAPGKLFATPEDREPIGPAPSQRFECGGGGRHQTR